MRLLKDFREFIGHASAIDMAVGVIIGGVLTTILKSFVDELVVPLTGLLGKVDFSNSYLVLKGAVGAGLPLSEARKVPGAVAFLGYGQFATVLVNTLILALAVFVVIRAISQIRKQQAESTPAAPPPQELLLAEIRDILKTRPA